MEKCRWHACQNDVVIDGANFCSNRCKNNFYVSRRRKELKLMAIAYKGGKCICCGYNGYEGTFDFHHLDPSQKDFALAQSGLTKSWKRIVVELDKCILVCANCHREIHAGYRPIPDCIEVESLELPSLKPVFQTKRLERETVKEFYAMPTKRVKPTFQESAVLRRKVERPPMEELLKEIEEDGYLATSRKYGVSDNAVRKWVRYYEKYEKPNS